MSGSMCIEPVSSVGFLLSPLAMSLTILTMDRERGTVRPETDGLLAKYGDTDERFLCFMSLACQMRAPGLGQCRIPEAITWLRNKFPDLKLMTADRFCGDITPLLTDDGIRRIIQPPLLPDGSVKWIAPSRGPSLFSRAYASPDDLLTEYRTTVGRKWPERFPWNEHVVTLSGLSIIRRDVDDTD